MVILQFNCLVYSGDMKNFGTNKFIMVGFIIENVGYSELKWVIPDIPDVFGTGLHYRITAKIERYDSEGNFIIVKPFKVLMR